MVWGRIFNKAGNRGVLIVTATESYFFLIFNNLVCSVLLSATGPGIISPQSSLYKTRFKPALARLK
jgi:hypothetical protein